MTHAMFRRSQLVAATILVLGWNWSSLGAEARARIHRSESRPAVWRRSR